METAIWVAIIGAVVGVIGHIGQRIGSRAEGRQATVSERQASAVRPVDPVFQLPGLPGEPVQVVADDRFELSGLGVGDHLVVRRPLDVPLRRRDRLIRVGLDHCPPAPGDDLLARRALPVDGETVHVAVEGYAQLDGCSFA